MSSDADAAAETVALYSILYVTLLGASCCVMALPYTVEQLYKRLLQLGSSWCVLSFASWSTLSWRLSML